MRRRVAGPEGPASIVIILALLLLAPHAAAQGSLSVRDVMRRVERYVASYGEKASIVVCTERYMQEAHGSGMTIDGTRTLVSDFALVKADAIRGWLGFRDVSEVDGHVVRDRNDRLVRMLLDAPGRYDEARRVSDESARYNLGFIERNFNVPTAALLFFVPENHDRFRFAARRVTDEGWWEIAFEERSKPSLIRTVEGASVPSAGTLWVRPEDGVVVRTLLTVDTTLGRSKPRRATGRIDVLYRRVDAMDMWLPASMDETFDAKRREDWERVSGHAEYSNCRQFTTAVRIK